MLRIILLTVAIAFLLSTAACIWADEIEEEIKTGLSSYQAGEYTKSISSLEFAVQQIRQLKAEKIELLFPAPLAGWNAEEAESVAVDHQAGSLAHT